MPSPLVRASAPPARLSLLRAAGIEPLVVVSRVDAMGVGAMRLHPVALARLTGGLGLGLGGSVRAEVEAALYPVADQYWVGGLAAGQSPIASVAAGLGVDIALGAK